MGPQSPNPLGILPPLGSRPWRSAPLPLLPQNTRSGYNFALAELHDIVADPDIAPFALRPLPSFS